MYLEDQVHNNPEYGDLQVFFRRADQEAPEDILLFGRDFDRVTFGDTKLVLIDSENKEHDCLDPIGIVLIGV